MPRKRVHELAREWGMDTTQVLLRLEEAGVHGKKAQSSLTESEVALIRPSAPPRETPALTLGEEKLVQQRVITEVGQGNDQLVTAREEVRETRIRPDVIRRRATREVLQENEPAPGESSPQTGEPQLSFSSSPPAIEEPFSPPPPLAFDLSFEEPSPLLPELPVEPTVPVSSVSPGGGEQPQTTTESRPVAAPPPPRAGAGGGPPGPPTAFRPADGSGSGGASCNAAYRPPLFP
jgi:hypothetical protein